MSTTDDLLQSILFILGLTAPAVWAGGFANVCASWTGDSTKQSLSASCPNNSGGTTQASIDLKDCVTNYLGAILFEKQSVA